MSSRDIVMKVRGFPSDRQAHKPVKSRLVNILLVDDMETEKKTMMPNFGCGIVYRVVRDMFGNVTTLKPLRKVLYYAEVLGDDRPETFKSLQRYCNAHPEFILMSEHEYLRDVYLKVAANPGAAITGYNISFDIFGHIDPRNVGPANGFYRGGLSGPFHGSAIRYHEKPSGVGRNRAFTLNMGRERVEMAQVIDCAQLVRSVTGNKHSLLSAGKALGCSPVKYDGKEIHDPEENYPYATLSDLAEYLDHYVGYCVNDVEACADLWRALELKRSAHPIGLDAPLWYSPASSAKQYLRKMGIHAPLCVCGKCRTRKRISDPRLGEAETSYYGGLAACGVRLTPLYGVVLDCTSQYPTGMINMDFWSLLTSSGITAREETESVRELIDRITLQDLYDPGIYPQLRGFCEIAASKDLLPFRGNYDETETSGAPNIGVNYVTTIRKNVTWTILDVVAAKIRPSGKIPRIVKAWRIYPEGTKQPTLKSVKLMGELDFDPSSDNLFKMLIEKRQVSKKDHKKLAGLASGWNSDTNYCLCPACDRANFLKVFANSLFGIFGEMNSQEPVRLRCKCRIGPSCGKSRCRHLVCISQRKCPVHNPRSIYGIGGEKLPARNPEMTGEYCFPPMASLTTGYGRLILAMIQAEVCKLGSHPIYWDTDSTAIPASPDGGIMDGIKLLTYDQVKTIQDRFETLNPYDPALGTKFLKMEWPIPAGDPMTIYKPGGRKGEIVSDGSPVLIVSLSAKRYVIYQRDNHTGKITILKRSEHGLGLYANPLQPDPTIEDDRKPDWYSAVWEYILRREVYGEEVDKPEWMWLPAVSAFPVKTLHTWKALMGKTRPSAFYLEYHHTGGKRRKDSGRLLAEAEYDSAKWYDLDVMDSATGDIVPIVTEPEAQWSQPGTVFVKSYSEVVEGYIDHAEIKYDGPDGEPCQYDTRGILQPCEVTAIAYELITKEATEVKPPDLATENIEYTAAPYWSDKDERSRELARYYLKRNFINAKKIAIEARVPLNRVNDFMADRYTGTTVTGRIVKYAAVKAGRSLGMDGWDINHLYPLSILSKWERHALDVIETFIPEG